MAGTCRTGPAGAAAYLSDHHRNWLAGCRDNALAESLFASLKGELIDTQPWPTCAPARQAIVDYISWYNDTRLHSTLGYRSPAEFEEQTKTGNVT